MSRFSAKQVLDRRLCRNPALYRTLIKLFPNGGRKQKDVYLKLVKDGNYVIDIGANVGTITILLSNIVGKSGKVFSYEPVEPTYAKLVSNINQSGFYKNITTFNYAVSDVAKNISIAVPGDDFGQASMQKHEKGSWSSASDCKIFQSSSILLDHHISYFPKLDFIKIDIEGAELLALKGASEIIKKFKPVLYLEVYKEWTKEFNYHPLDLYQYVRSLGYTEYFIVTNKGIEELVNPGLQLNQDYSADLFCIYN